MKSDIIVKLENHDKSFDFLIKKAEEHDKKFEEHDQRFDLLAAKLLEHDEKFDRVFNKLVDHDVRLERIEQNMATKEDMNNIVNSIDKFVGLHTKHDQEMVFMGARVSRNEQDIKLIKPLVGLN